MVRSADIKPYVFRTARYTQLIIADDPFLGNFFCPVGAFANGIEVVVQRRFAGIGVEEVYQFGILAAIGYIIFAGKELEAMRSIKGNHRFTAAALFGSY